VPNGTSEGMPTGLHLVADHFQEEKLFNAAYTYES
jgi:Asp-tRNA(Asn)/Glu-tRNA(Gln) amidotransferase A subunit family amidase